MASLSPGSCRGCWGLGGECWWQGPWLCQLCGPWQAQPGKPSADTLLGNHRHPWHPLLALPLPSCVTVGRTPNLCGPQKLYSGQYLLAGLLWGQSEALGVKFQAVSGILEEDFAPHFPWLKELRQTGPTDRHASFMQLKSHNNLF